MTEQERATLRDLYSLVESVRSEMGDGFASVDSRLRPIEHYITADKARKAERSAFVSGMLRFMTVLAAIITAAVGAAGFILTLVRLLLHV